MKSNVNFVLFCVFCLHFYVTPSLAEKRLRQTYNVHNPYRPDLKIYNAKRTNPTPNTSFRSYYPRYVPKARHYENYMKHNRPGIYNSYQPPNFPWPPVNFPFQNKGPSFYDMDDPYIKAKLVKPEKYRPSDQLKHMFVEDMPIYPDIKHKVENNPALNVQEPLFFPKEEKENISNDKKYLIIHPNGTMENVNDLATVAASHPHYVLVNMGDVIPIGDKFPVDNLLKTTEISGDNKDNVDSTAIPSSVETERLSMMENTPTTIIEIEPQLTNLSNDDVDIKTEEDVNISSPLDSSVFPKDTRDIKNQTKIKDNNVTSSDEFDKKEPLRVSKSDHKADKKLNTPKDNEPENDSSNFILKLLQQLPSFFIETGTKLNFEPFYDTKVNKTDELNESQTPDKLNENTTENTNPDNMIGKITSIVENISKLIVSKKKKETSGPDGNAPERNMTQKSEGFKPKSSNNELKKSAIPNDDKITLKNGDIDLHDKVNLTEEKGNVLSQQKETLHHELPVNPFIVNNGESAGINTFADNSTQMPKSDILYILPKEVPVEKIEDLQGNQVIDDSISVFATTVSTDKLQDLYEVSTSETNINSKINEDSTNMEGPTDPQKQPDDFSYVEEDFWKTLDDKKIPYEIIYFFQYDDDSTIKKDTRTMIYPNKIILKEPESTSLDDK